MTITALPTPPSRSDPANFAARGDALLGALPTLVTEMNAATAEVDVDRAAAAASASAALASQNAAATHLGNSGINALSASNSAQAALAAAAATQAGLPAQADTSGRVLRSEFGLAVWGYQLRPATLVQRVSSVNQIPDSSALNHASWGRGPNVSSTGFDQTIPGPNGLRSVLVTQSAVGNAYLAFSYTPVQGQTQTISVWYMGYSKPTSGSLLAADYRDASNALQRATLPFSDASIIADGKWRRYGLTWTHAGSNVSVLNSYVVVDAGVGGHRIADPQLEVGAASAYVATGYAHLSEPSCSYDIDTQGGSVAVFLPAAFEHGMCIGFKDVGRAASVNNINILRNGTLIESAAIDIDVDIDGASFTVQFANRRGWLIK